MHIVYIHIYMHVSLFFYICTYPTIDTLLKIQSPTRRDKKNEKRKDLGNCLERTLKIAFPLLFLWNILTAESISIIKPQVS